MTDFLHPMPVEAMWGVGRSTTAKLNRLGVFTVGELARPPADALSGRSARMPGAMLHHLASGA